MKAFAALYSRLDATTSSNTKLQAMQEYFALAPAADAAWAVYFLAGGRPRQLVPTKVLRALVLQASSLPEWLFEESYQAVGDLAETIALLLPPSQHTSDAGLAEWVEDKLLPLRGLPPEELLARLLPLLNELDRNSQFVCIKLITGSFRVGVSKLLVTRALAALTGIDAKEVAQRLVGYTDLSAKPSPEDFERMIAPSDGSERHEKNDGQPYPFFLAHPLQLPVEEFETVIGTPDQWQVEWKWDGIRSQLVKRKGQLWVWSRGEELVTERFPELGVLAGRLPDGTVIDGEIVTWKDNRVQPFALLQQRIGRKSLTPKVLNAAPVAVLAYDLLEWQGEDWRTRPQHERRAQLEQVVAAADSPVLKVSPELKGESWQALAKLREDSRKLGVEGMMLKARSAHYGVGRTKDVGTWWKWKIDPYTVD
ncbi:MAG TPA: cisplatin damage response ATP-dependent DNA ligase, partial [Methylophilaceae bacterium]|nr:cisplatin damage response ATP-dependent DNA ligase [Methylophilaceae bacterium]